MFHGRPRRGSLRQAGLGTPVPFIRDPLTSFQLGGMSLSYGRSSGNTERSDYATSACKRGDDPCRQRGPAAPRNGAAPFDQPVGACRAKSKAVLARSVQRASSQTACSAARPGGLRRNAAEEGLGRDNRSNEAKPRSIPCR